MERLQDTYIDTHASVIELLEFLVKKAVELRASDIHIDPRKEDVRVRLRIDGELFDISPLGTTRYSEIISRIKILAGLRIDEHTRAQDGRFRLNLSPPLDWIDVRVSILPTYHGENAVLRLLANQSTLFELESLGFSPSDLEKINTVISRESGMVLITGPTGSGKTTTLYAMIQKLNRPSLSVITIEEPIEYSIPGVRQIQVNYQSNLNFANGLRSLLRQDPNIIMVGEIRDRETASIATNAALTGHLVLSTLHTNEAAATLPRLLDMGVESFLLASTFSIALNQRLVKKLCSYCKVQAGMTHTQKDYLSRMLEESVSNYSIYAASGCPRCNGSGYEGRIAVSEILLANENIRAAILDKRPTPTIRQLAKESGMKTLLEASFDKVKTGLTSLEEMFTLMYE